MVVLELLFWLYGMFIFGICYMYGIIFLMVFDWFGYDKKNENDREIYMKFYWLFRIN